MLGVLSRNAKCGRHFLHVYVLSALLLTFLFALHECVCTKPQDASAAMNAMKEMAAKNQTAWEAASEMRETVKSHEKMLMKVISEFTGPKIGIYIDCARL